MRNAGARERQEGTPPAARNQTRDRRALTRARARGTLRPPEGSMAHTPEQVIEIEDAASGLQAFLVLDDTTLGPAAGGIRTRAYPPPADARNDAARLARAMTIKCAIAGLAAGGGKCVVIDHPRLDRAAAFAVLGDRIESLAGRFRTAG